MSELFFAATALADFYVLSCERSATNMEAIYLISCLEHPVAKADGGAV